MIIFPPMMKEAKVGGIVLAAGLSRRFGREKLLLPLAGLPLGFWPVKAALAAGLEPVVLVTRPELADALATGSETVVSRVTLVVNEEPGRGQSHSLNLGLDALGDSADYALILLADQPLVTAKLIGRFVQAARQGAPLAAAVLEDRFVPPVLFRRDYFDELRGVKGDEGGRTVLDRHRAKVVQVAPESASLLADLDRPEDLRRILEAL